MNLPIYDIFKPILIKLNEILKKRKLIVAAHHLSLEKNNIANV